MHGKVEYCVFLTSLHSKMVKKVLEFFLETHSNTIFFLSFSKKYAAHRTQNTLTPSHKTAKRKPFGGKVKRFRRTLNLAAKPASVFPRGSIVPAAEQLAQRTLLHFTAA